MTFWKSRRSKYSAQPTKLDGYHFPSKLEASVYQTLKLMQMAKEIEIEKVQDQLYLSAAKIGYRVDFRVKNLLTNKIEYHEAKGVETSRFMMIKRLWKVFGVAPLVIWKGHWKNPKISEVIPGGAE